MANSWKQRRKNKPGSDETGLLLLTEDSQVKRGTIRRISWTRPATMVEELSADVTTEGARPKLGAKPLVRKATASVQGPLITSPAPKDAIEEARVLLRIAAEVEGALLAQYLYLAYSVLPGLSLTPPGFRHPIVSDDWSDTVRDIAKQEMGHLITVQNLLLALNDVPHLDREQFPTKSELYPFPFQLEPLGLIPLAKAVAAEAPNVVSADDRVDYQDAATRAKVEVGKVSRVGQIYERLYWLFQDSDTKQPPWNDVVNPFPTWKKWHVPPERVGFNQDRQAQTNEWRGDPAGASPDTAIYVLPVPNKASAREAIFRIAQQGEGPTQDEELDSHFDKFLRLYREYRAYDAMLAGPDKPRFVRDQVSDPSTVTGSKPGFITDLKALAWAELANTRYRMLLMEIALALSVGASGSVTGTTAVRRDFVSWAFREMRGGSGIKDVGQELLSMPIKKGDPRSVVSGIPFELPDGRNLPTTTPEQVLELRNLVNESQECCKKIRASLGPTPGQQSLLAKLEAADKSMAYKIGS
jgi:hypothetical protein